MADTRRMHHATSGRARARRAVSTGGGAAGDPVIDRSRTSKQAVGDIAVVADSE